MSSVLNISAYRFVSIDDIDGLRTRLFESANTRHLKGTVIVAPEGINLFLAGEKTHIESFVHELKADSRFSDLAPKQSWSAHQPFRKLLVKVKKEIIRMDHPTIQPAQGRAPSVTAETLNRWLDQGHDDQGRPVVLLDTRNAFEVDHGTFKNAIDYRITKFTEFPQAIRTHQNELTDKTIVSFCTGGIRCEKAAIYMRNLGLLNTYQLEGGILKYFEETDAHHFKGSCFVFDERELLDAKLKPAGKTPATREARGTQIADGVRAA